MAELLRVAIVGHVNAGKTTLVRTLARQAGFGAVAALPGSTLDAAAALAAPDAGAAPLEWIDTPGFEDPVPLAARLAALPQPGAVQRLAALLDEPDLAHDHPSELAALTVARDSHALVLVVDSVELVLPKHLAGLALLQACCRPLILVLNRPGHAMSQASAWERAAAGHGLRDVLRLDACGPGDDAMLALLRMLSGLLAPHHPQAVSLAATWQAARLQRQQSGVGFIAHVLVWLAARRETLPAGVAGDAQQKAQAVAAFRATVLAEVDAARRRLAARHGFAGHVPASGGLPGLAGRWEDDLFNREVLKDAGGKLAGGAAVGAAIGLGADVALAGLSLGAGTAVGAAVGGMASQGFSSFSRKVLNRITGQLDLSVEDGVLVALAEHLLAWLQALALRAHGAVGPWAWPPNHGLVAGEQAALLDALRPARGHPEWAASEAGLSGGLAARQRVVDAVAGLLAAHAALTALAAPTVAAGTVTIGR
jgi:hypothetical protein